MMNGANGWLAGRALISLYQLRAGAKPPEPPEPVDGHFNFAGRRDRSLSPTKGKAP